MSSELHVLPYALVVLLGALSPGPDFALVTRHAALHGRRAGVAAGVGIGGGMAVNTLAALLGVGAVIAAAPWLYATIRYLGAAYLVYLGAMALLSLRRRSGGEEASEPGPDGPPPGRGQVGSAFRQGLITNILNPKAIVFLVALMPQFMPAAPSVLDRVVVGSVTTAVTLGWFVLVALAVSALRRVFRRPAVRRGLNAVTGTLLVGLAVRLVLT
ncbi:LysE family translocator [Micromonospora sagamiensis]|uniref:Threonine/homoserine/homoserine lactone efflux protein n=1 Tax=Micromonospora sagamiensis TaxID=47875 RepID=A0A562WNR3_9ACTN|nr:LysE family transporter [Micromonospora sagamiensis]TWJ31826.1 threonine/homoserine/homoserine lactone efflux protein [Micromonospora sagamiensis]BCL15120.1 amino acid transporter LysE [Micromonospora sagamiensis]